MTSVERISAHKIDTVNEGWSCSSGVLRHHIHRKPSIQELGAMQHSVRPVARRCSAAAMAPRCPRRHTQLGCRCRAARLRAGAPLAARYGFLGRQLVHDERRGRRVCAKRHRPLRVHTFGPSRRPSPPELPPTRARLVSSCISHLHQTAPLESNAAPVKNTSSLVHLAVARTLTASQASCWARYMRKPRVNTCSER